MPEVRQSDPYATSATKSIVLLSPMPKIEDNDSLLRYSRHILLSEFGVEGQEKIREATALIVGGGGLGCPAAIYLATSGIGRLVVVDNDEIDLTNLQRQILYTTEDIGKGKAATVAQQIRRLNSDVNVVPVNQRLCSENAAKLFAETDLVIDGCDNFATRHLVNRTCLALKKPLVSGAAMRFEGQLAVFDPAMDESPCYSCLFPENTSYEDEPCSRMGVLAPLTGIMGSLMAAEALKAIVDGACKLAGTLVLVDAYKMEFKRIKIPKDPDCPACSRR